MSKHYVSRTLGKLQKGLAKFRIVELETARFRVYTKKKLKFSKTGAPVEFTRKLAFRKQLIDNSKAPDGKLSKLRSLIKMVDAPQSYSKYF